MIRVENVSLKLGGAQILEDISLEIPKQGITALVGANGAGKSTLLSLIARLQPLQAGKVTVDELEIGACANDVLARRLAILPQTAEASTRLTVRELVSFGRYPHHKGRPLPEDHKHVQAAIEAFELEPLQNRVLDTLSGGQRQRAHVAMTYAQDTDYVLLDEPLNNLDLAGAKLLMQLLRRMADDMGRSVIIVLHDINVAARYADRIVAMKGGRLHSVGAPKDLVTGATIKDVFGVDVGVHMVDGLPTVAI